MKKLLFILVLGGFLYACGGESKEASSEKNTEKKEEKEAELTQEDTTTTENTEKKEEKEAELTQEDTTITENTAKNQNEEVASDKPTGQKYRCDGFRPGIVSEWLQIQYNKAHDKVLAIWYWNVKDQTPVKLEIINQEFSEGEISGFIGEVRFPNDKTKIGLGIIEDRANLTPEGEKMQEFTLEM